MLFTTLALRGITLRNRIVVSPMCQYSCTDGMATEWHLVHLGSRAVGGAALVMTEATAVEARGRISAADLGIWDDAHVPSLERIARFIHSQGALAGMQLAHAGRKASVKVPWQGGAAVMVADGGWEVVGPSAIPFDEASPVPRSLSIAGSAGRGTRVRQGREPSAGGRVPGAGDPRGPRVSHPRVSLADLQHPGGRLWRKLR